MRILIIKFIVFFIKVFLYGLTFEVFYYIRKKLDEEVNADDSN